MWARVFWLVAVLGVTRMTQRLCARTATSLHPVSCSKDILHHTEYYIWFMHYCLLVCILCSSKSNKHRSRFLFYSHFNFFLRSVVVVSKILDKILRCCLFVCLLATTTVICSIELSILAPTVVMMMTLIVVCH